VHTVWGDETDGLLIKTFRGEIVRLQADMMAFKIHWIVSVRVEDTYSDAILQLEHFTDAVETSSNSDSDVLILTRYTNVIYFRSQMPHTLNHTWRLERF
jgi:hypothetical protein